MWRWRRWEASIVQLGPMRIAIAKAAVLGRIGDNRGAAVAKVSFDSYRHGGMLKERPRKAERHSHRGPARIGKVHLRCGW